MNKMDKGQRVEVIAGLSGQRATIIEEGEEGMVWVRFDNHNAILNHSILCEQWFEVDNLKELPQDTPVVRSLEEASFYCEAGGHHVDAETYVATCAECEKAFCPDHKGNNPLPGHLVACWEHGVEVDAKNEKWDAKWNEKWGR